MSQTAAANAAESESEGLPAKFGKYTLIRRVASGGMAELFLAIQRSVAGFEKLLVIKRILPSMNQDRAFIDMLLHEARIAATLSHPNIVQIFDVGQEDGQFYIAMEHVHGEDLRSIVRQMTKQGLTEFPLQQVLQIFIGICSGLAHAHEMRGLDERPLGIVHRDISPQNILVTFTGDVKIVDFGIAKSDSYVDNTKSGMLKGKVPYMSPEQARGQEIDARSDIFATGVMLFELTTGKRLFKGKSDYETLKLICDREYPRPSEIVRNYPADLEKIVMRALAKDRNARYQNAREMQADLEAFVRAKQIVVSSLELNRFMSTLFVEKLAEQKEALLQGKQLADVLNARPERAERTGGSTIPPPPEKPRPVLQAVPQPASEPSQPVSIVPPAANTVTTVRPRQSHALALGAGFAALMAIGVIGGAGYVLTKKNPARVVAPPPPPAVVVAKGSLAITSEPSGASIWIDGDLRPEKTPAKIENLPTGVAVDVKVTIDGFEQAKQTLTLDGPGEAKFELKKVAAIAEPRAVPEPKPRKVSRAAPEKEPPSPAPTPAPPPVPAGNGKLNVGASGGWCDVTIDGAARGATPIAGVELPAGPHKLSCTTADGKKLDASVTIAPGETARYKFSL